MAANKRQLRGDEPASSKENGHFYSKILKFTSVKQKQKSNDEGGKDGEEQEEEEERNTLKRSNGVKRKQLDEREGESEEELRSLRNKASVLRQRRRAQRVIESEEDGAETREDEERNRAVLSTRMTQLGVRTLHLPDDPSLCSVFVSCLNSQPRVIIEKLPVTSSASTDGTDRAGKYVQQQRQRKKSVKATSNEPQKLDLTDFPDLDDKE